MKMYIQMIYKCIYKRNANVYHLYIQNETMKMKGMSI